MKQPPLTDDDIRRIIREEITGAISRACSAHIPELQKAMSAGEPIPDIAAGLVALRWEMERRTSAATRCKECGR